MPKFLIVVWPICSVTVLRGTHWVPWCILKPDIYGYNISVVLFSCFKKFKCLGDVLASVSLPEFAKLRSQLLDVFIIGSDFDLAQHFSCSVKTVECGQLFILACGQLWKKAQHNFIAQFKNLLKVPTDRTGQIDADGECVSTPRNARSWGCPGQNKKTWNLSRSTPLKAKH